MIAGGEGSTLVICAYGIRCVPVAMSISIASGTSFRLHDWAPPRSFCVTVRKSISNYPVHFVWESPYESQYLGLLITCTGHLTSYTSVNNESRNARHSKHCTHGQEQPSKSTENNRAVHAIAVSHGSPPVPGWCPGSRSGSGR